MPNWFRKKIPEPAASQQREENESRLNAMPDLPALEFYAEPQAHLLDELRWLNRLLAAHVLRLRRANFYEGLKDFRGFFIAEEEIDALLAAGIFESEASQDAAGQDATRQKLSAKLLRQAQDFRQEINKRVQQSRAQKFFLPLAHLAECFTLGEFEQQALIICLAPQIDARYEKLYAYLQNDIAKKSPSVDLILGLLLQNLEERLRGLACFHAGAPLRYYGLLESVESEAGTSSALRFLRADGRVLHYALHQQIVDERVRPYLRFLPPLSWEEVVVPAELQARLRRLFRAAAENVSPQRVHMYLHGRTGEGKKTIARALCGELEMPMAVVDVKALLRTPDSFPEKVRLILRESLLQPCAVYFDHLEKLESAAEENPSLVTEMLREIQALGWLTFLGSENPPPSALLDLPGIFAVVIPTPDHAAQKILWQRHLENAGLEIDELAARFDLTPGQIARAAQRAQQAAFVRDPENARPAFADLLASSRAQSQPKLSTLARKIEAKFGWSDLVLPEDQMRQLRELVTQVQRKHVVMSEWGFASKLSLGRGLNVLFAGPSGTGKTMAAEVMANDLGLDLYKVDLSAVVSKYIGETEKNLNRVFTEAEHSNAILFFDEADALMGKRSEVRDAHDRYANIEIAYLLQKMEEYEGITILATNLRQNLDEAFTRRIRFIVEFPFPNEENRLRIWQGIWPRATPLAPEVDLNFLARSFKLTGGNIRNIALAAAFLASENGREVRMKHLLQAAKREFQKMGKPVKEEEFEA